MASLQACTGASPSAFAIWGLPPARRATSAPLRNGDFGATLRRLDAFASTRLVAAFLATVLGTLAAMMFASGLCGARRCVGACVNSGMRRQEQAPTEMYIRSLTLTIMVLVCLSPVTFGAQNQTATVHVQVRASEKPVEDAEVVVAGTTHRTDAAGVATIITLPGTVEITVMKSGFAPATARVQVAGGETQDVIVELEVQPTVEETITVVASTRTDKRLEDQPMRVEVLAREEIEEKMLMTPGDIVMMLN